MKTAKYLTVILTVLTLFSCSNAENETRTAESTTASDDKGFIEFDGITYTLDWTNCRLSETRWQASSDDTLLGIDIDQRANVGSEGYNYFINVNLSEVRNGPATSRYYNHWLTTGLDIEVSNTEISGTAYVHPRSISQSDVESLRKPIEFSIRC